jgi:hypothetical protein
MSMDINMRKYWGHLKKKKLLLDGEDKSIEWYILQHGAKQIKLVGRVHVTVSYSD